MLSNMLQMSNKNKFIFTVLFIVALIVVVFVVLKKFKLISKLEHFIDDEDEEGYEDDETDQKEEFDDKPTTSTANKASSEPPKTSTTPVIVKPEERKKEEKTKGVNEKKDVKPIDDLSTQIKNGFDQLYNRLQELGVSQNDMKKALNDFMNSIDTMSKTNVSAHSVVSKIVEKYMPKKDTFVDEPVVLKSMDKVVYHLNQALDEVKAMSSTNVQSVAKVPVNERFSPSREVTNVHTRDAKKTEVIEGFENTPHYALY